MKSAAVILAVVTLISAGAGLAVLAGRDGGPPQDQGRQRRTRGPRSGVDRYGDPLPKGAIARLGTTRFRHDEQISSRLLHARWQDAGHRPGRRPASGTWPRAGSSGRSTPAGKWRPRRMAGRCSRPGRVAPGRSIPPLAANCGGSRLDPTDNPDRLAVSPDGKSLAVLPAFRSQMRRRRTSRS